MKVKITPRQFSFWLAGLAEGKLQQAVKRGLVSGALRCVTVMQRRTEEAPPASPGGSVGAFDTGMYKAAWKSSETADGSRVFNSRPYAGVIEGGRRPSPVSREGQKQLAGWVRRKMGLSESEAKGVAYVIARKMKERPLQARNVLSGGVEEMTKVVMAEVDRELDKALK